MTERKRTRPPVRPGVRVIDGKGTGTVMGNTGLPPLCDPRVWVWVDWDGERGMKVARVAELTTTGEET